MEQRQQKPSVTLKYAKRRFDGGSEIDLIRTIEVAQMHKMYGPEQTQPQNFSAPLNLAPGQAQNQTAQAQPIVRSRRTRMTEAAIRGPLQICIGIVGMLTAGLAVVTFHKTNNQVLLAQSWTVFHDCRKALGKGLLDCLTTPARVWKASHVKA